MKVTLCSVESVLLTNSTPYSNGGDDLHHPLEPQPLTHYAIATLNDKSFPQTRQMLTYQARTRAILCEPCNGKGWLLCDFCKGQKTNVKSESNRTYRRCPSCRAIGYVLCTKCKVFKCVTFTDYSDGEELSF